MPRSETVSVRRAALRVALAAAGAVAVIYAIVAVGTFYIVGQRLTAGIDGRLEGTLDGIDHRPQPPSQPSSLLIPGESRGDRLQPRRLVWIVHPDGEVTSSFDLALPPEYRHVSDPQTITIGGEELRVQGRAINGVYVVVGQSMSVVNQAQITLAEAELLVAPPLLILVFGGAFVIGRRAQAPIELARRRQLEFTADASHELRTPLSVIEAEASLALTGRRPATWYREAFGRVDAEARRMRRLVDDMLWLARFDAKASVPASEPVDLGILAEGAVDRFKVVAETRGQQLDLDVQPGLVVTAYPAWVDRVLGVLLDNACRHAPDGGRILADVTAAEGRVRIRVQDSGTGIPEEERSRIFDRFHRATEAPGGAGLGLAIADAVVTATGGRWEVGSSSLGGASLAVTWPRAW